MDDQVAQPIPLVDPPQDQAAQSARRRWKWILGGLVCLTFGSLVGLGLVATLVVPRVLERFQFASTRKVEVDIFAIDSALDEFGIANGGKSPDSLELLVTPDVNGQTFLDANHIPKDPWGREYRYDPPGPGQPRPRVYSYGRDGQPGGEGDDADIDSLSLVKHR